LALGKAFVCELTSTELVVGCHHKTSAEKLTAFTKWCPAENGVKTFDNAEKAIDLALSRLGQKYVALMQCEFPCPYLLHRPPIESSFAIAIHIV